MPDDTLTAIDIARQALEQIIDNVLRALALTGDDDSDIESNRTRIHDTTTRLQPNGIERQ